MIKFEAGGKICYNTNVMLKRYRKFIGLILTLVFISTAFFGLNMGMDMRQDGTMSGCMFDQSVTCPMNYQEHINHWQQTFTATQPTQNLALTLLLVIALDSTALLFYSSLKQHLYTQTVPHILQNIQKQREITAKLSDYILQILSNGILNPKLYNFSPTLASG